MKQELRSFILIELLVVVAIIAGFGGDVVAGVVVGAGACVRVEFAKYGIGVDAVCE